MFQRFILTSLCHCKYKTLSLKPFKTNTFRIFSLKEIRRDIYNTYKNRPHPKQIVRNFHNEKKFVSLESRFEGNNFSYKQDIPLYINDSSIFKYIGFFSISQFIFWSYLSLQSYEMKDIPVYEEDVKKAKEEGQFISLGRQLNLGRYKNFLSIFCATIGVLAVCLTTLYTKRSVRRITLLKGGENTIVEFFTVLGKGKKEVVPLSNISAMSRRQSSGSYVILQLKGWKLYVIVDKEGHFPNQELFDNALGMRRTWAK